MKSSNIFKMICKYYNKIAPLILVALSISYSSEAIASNLSRLLTIQKEHHDSLPEFVMDMLVDTSKRRVEAIIDQHYLDGLPNYVGDKEWKCLAEALYFEARGESVIGQFKRANNILAKAEQKDGVEYSFGADVKYMEDVSERELFDALTMQHSTVKTAVSGEDFQKAILAISDLRKPIDFFFNSYWSENGCAILQPYDMEVGAGTFHPATTLRSLGENNWAAAYVQPSRRPSDGRYGENPNRLQHYYQYQVIMKPSPENFQDLYLRSLEAIGLSMSIHDIRFVEDDWESPTLGAWGLGWEVWCDGMEVSQFTYFQQVGGHDCKPVSGELTYGLERLAMYVLGVNHVMDMPFNSPDAPVPLKYGDIFLQTEQEYARWNFDVANTDILLRNFEEAEKECERILSHDELDPKTGKKIIMVHPAYDFCIKASHFFNLLDARGVISVTERQAYIARVRNLAKKCADAFLQTVAGGQKN